VDTLLCHVSYKKLRGGVTAYSSIQLGKRCKKYINIVQNFPVSFEKAVNSNFLTIIFGGQEYIFQRKMIDKVAFELIAYKNNAKNFNEKSNKKR
jgi:hypothetical protein